MVPYTFGKELGLASNPSEFGIGGVFKTVRDITLGRLLHKYRQENMADRVKRLVGRIQYYCHQPSSRRTRAWIVASFPPGPMARSLAALKMGDGV